MKVRTLAFETQLHISVFEKYENESDKNIRFLKNKSSISPYNDRAPHLDLSSFFLLQNTFHFIYPASEKYLL